jgi:prepilin-type N-terminal cleavage/methylation domain-containing protein|tara:strand:- start:2170 stop:2562 length:393 start_codon:yes stop_codon:yes gene_type:complete
MKPLTIKNLVKGFTLIELLVVVAIIGVLSAIGIVAYSGISESSKRSQAETTMQSIYLAQQEYKSNNGQFYYNSNTTNIVNNLFDGVDDLSGQEYNFSITGNASAGTMCIRATRSGSATLYLNHLKKKTNC